MPDATPSPTCQQCDDAIFEVSAKGLQILWFFGITWAFQALLTHCFSSQMRALQAKASAHIGQIELAAPCRVWLLWQVTA